MTPCIVGGYSEECSATIMRVEVYGVRNRLNYVGSKDGGCKDPKAGVVLADDHENDSFEDCSVVFHVKAEMELRERWHFSDQCHRKGKKLESDLTRVVFTCTVKHKRNY